MTNAGKKILVTGAAGFIGSYAVQAYLKLGFSVVGIDNINDYYPVKWKYIRLAAAGIAESQAEKWGNECTSSLNPSYRFFRMDLCDAGSINSLFKREAFAIVCNLAAQAGVRYSIENPASYIQSNIVGFLNILEACRAAKVEHLVYASSSSVYGMSAKIPYSEAEACNDPESLYAATKKSNEMMARVYSRLYGLPATGLRFFTVYGPWGRPDMAPILFASAILKGRPIKVFNNGKLERDFTYIDDIIEGLVRVTQSPPQLSIPHRVYNIGHSQPVNLMDFIHTIEEAAGRKAIMEMAPMQAGDVYCTFADTSALERDFGYKASTSLKEGIEALMKQILSNPDLIQ